MVGYASLKTFRRAFQKETGFTPAGYRESVLV
ncbi:AraC family transcriptional regulator [uncultured Acetatifactor sp.]